MGWPGQWKVLEAGREANWLSPWSLPSSPLGALVCMVLMAGGGGGGDGPLSKPHLGSTSGAQGWAPWGPCRDRESLRSMTACPGQGSNLGHCSSGEMVRLSHHTVQLPGMSGRHSQATYHHVTRVPCLTSRSLRGPCPSAGDPGTYPGHGWEDCKKGGGSVGREGLATAAINPNASEPHH